MPWDSRKGNRSPNLVPDYSELAISRDRLTINAPATVLLALYSLVGEEQGVPLGELRGTTQNDVLKEYIARGNFIYPPEGTMRLTTDLLAWSAGDAAWVRRRARRA